MLLHFSNLWVPNAQYTYLFKSGSYYLCLKEEWVFNNQLMRTLNFENTEDNSAHLCAPLSESSFVKKIKIAKTRVFNEDPFRREKSRSLGDTNQNWIFHEDAVIGGKSRPFRINRATLSG